MAIWTSLCRTNQGRALDAKVASGQTPLIITKAVSGAGKVNPVLLPSLTAIPEPKQNLDIFDKQLTEDSDEFILPIKLDNGDVAEGYKMFTMGIYATDPDLGEILYMVCQTAAEEGERIPSATEQPAFSIQWNNKIKMADASQVSIEVTEVGLLTQDIADSLYVLRSDGNIYTKRVNDITVETAQWKQDGTFDDYPFKANILVQGVTAAEWACISLTPDHTDSTLDSLCSFVFIGEGVLSLWIDAVPNHDILIESVVFEKVV